MMKIIERVGGLFHTQEQVSGGRTKESSPFTKGSDKYKALTADGCQVVLMPKAEKDAHKKEQAEEVIIQKLAALDLPPHTLAMAISGDSEALDKVIKAESLKFVLREKLAAIK